MWLALLFWSNFIETGRTSKTVFLLSLLTIFFLACLVSVSIPSTALAQTQSKSLAGLGLDINLIYPEVNNTGYTAVRNDGYFTYDNADGDQISIVRFDQNPVRLASLNGGYVYDPNVKVGSWYLVFNHFSYDVTGETYYDVLNFSSTGYIRLETGGACLVCNDLGWAIGNDWSDTANRQYINYTKTNLGTNELNVGYVNNPYNTMTVLYTTDPDFWRRGSGNISGLVLAFDDSQTVNEYVSDRNTENQFSLINSINSELGSISSQIESFKNAVINGMSSLSNVIVSGNDAIVSNLGVLAGKSDTTNGWLDLIESDLQYISGQLERTQPTQGNGTASNYLVANSYDDKFYNSQKEPFYLITHLGEYLDPMPDNSSSFRIPVRIGNWLNYDINVDLNYLLNVDGNGYGVSLGFFIRRGLGFLLGFSLLIPAVQLAIREFG